MVGVSVIGLTEAMEKPSGFPELGADYTNMERMMLEAILSECQNCISSEGRDCMLDTGSVSCPFVEVRRTCGIHSMEDW